MSKCPTTKESCVVLTLLETNSSQTHAPSQELAARFAGKVADKVADIVKDSSQLCGPDVCGLEKAAAAYAILNTAGDQALQEMNRGN